MTRSAAGDNLLNLLDQERQLAQVIACSNWSEGEEIAREGEACLHFMVIREGQVVLSRRPAAGRERTLALLGPGDIFGEDALRPERTWKQSGRALTHVCAYRFSAKALPKLAEYYPAVNTAIIGALLERLEMAHRRLELMEHQGAMDRVTALLQFLAGKPDPETGSYVALPRLTQVQMGEMLGIARETVARAMAELERQGTIRRTGRHIWLRHQLHLLGAMVVVMARLASGPAYPITDEQIPPPRGKRGRVIWAPARPLTVALHGSNL
jgi:CRP/FNR family transcriptional regulator